VLVRARYAQHDAHFKQLQQQRRAAVGEERQRNAGGRQEIRHNTDIEEHLYSQQRGDARRSERAEAVACVHRDPVAAHDEQDKQQDDDERADETELLADDGEDVVVVLLGQVEILLAAAAESEPHEAAGADRIERLQNLVAGVGRVGGRIAPGRDALAGVTHRFEVDDGKYGEERAADEKPADLHTAEEHHGRADDQHDDDAGEMAFQHQKTADDDQDCRERQHAITESLHLLPIGRHERGKGQYDGELCQLGRLEAHKAEIQPALGAVLRGADDRHEQQEKDRDTQHQKRRASPDLVVDAAHEEHEGNADNGKNCLPCKVIGGIAFNLISSGIAGRKHHDDADGHKQDRQNQERHIEQAALVENDLGFSLVRQRQLLGFFRKKGRICALSHKRSPFQRGIIRTCA